MQQEDRYTYENAGFSGFMLRSLKSNPGAQTLRGSVSMGTPNGFAFDRKMVDGQLGDIVQVGRLILDGVAGRMRVLDEARTTETGWVGDLRR